MTNAERAHPLATRRSWSFLQIARLLVLVEVTLKGGSSHLDPVTLYPTSLIHCARGPLDVTDISAASFEPGLNCRADQDHCFLYRSHQMNL